MLNFIYDSLETVKNLKFPGVKIYVTLTIAIFAVVIVSGLYFVFADSIFSELYQLFYESMRGVAEITGTDTSVLNTVNDAVLTGMAE